MEGVGAERNPFAALGNAQRRAIVELLARGPRSVQELADDLPISRPAVSRHLRLLGAAGLVRDQQVGTRRVYQFEDAGLEEIQGYLQRVWGEAAVRFKLYAENTAQAKGRK